MPTSSWKVNRLRNTATKLQPRLVPEKFDLIVIAVILILLAGIGMTVWHGDQIGISVQRFDPTVMASSRTAIRITFDEPIQLASVASHFHISPAVAGKFTTVDRALIFQPIQALQPGQPYEVMLDSGIAASSGRLLKSDLHWQFNVRAPQLAYLSAPPDGVANLYALDPTKATALRHLTNSDRGITGYDVLPDGSKIVYSESRGDDPSNLYVLDTQTGVSTLLYQCQDASCTHPMWRPDGGAVAFEVVQLNTNNNTDVGLPRVWLFDLANNSAHPLFKDDQQLGYSPHWSPDGTRLAVYNANVSGIVVHNFLANTDTTIRAEDGEVGQFSPDGRWLYYPKIVQISDKVFVVHLELVDLTTDPYQQHDLVPDSDPFNDIEAAWQADSKSLIVARHQPYEGGPLQPQPQLYNIDVATGKISPLVVDNSYKNSNIEVSPTGDLIVFERFNIDQTDATTEIWLGRLDTHALQRIAANGFGPRWLP